MLISHCSAGARAADEVRSREASPHLRQEEGHLQADPLRGQQDPQPAGGGERVHEEPAAAGCRAAAGGPPERRCRGRHGSRRPPRRFAALRAAE